MVVFCVLLGLSLKGVAIHDVFRTLFHPAGRGALSDFVARGVWNIFRRLAQHRKKIIVLGGPYALVTIIFVWTALIVFGNAFIYWPFIAKYFVMAPGMNIVDHTSFFDALNISLGALITVAGDFNSNSRWLRLLMGFEGVFGFGLLTASVSWLLSIYPVLEHRRSLAHEITLLHKAEEITGSKVTALPEKDLYTLLIGLTEQLSTIRNDLSQFPITYYFHMGERNTATPGTLSFLYDLAEECSKPDHGISVRMAAATLGGAVTDYANLVAEVFLREKGKNSKEIIRLYAKDHMRELMPENPERWAA
jgi:hypothetical protein